MAVKGSQLRSKLFEQHNIIGLFTQRLGGISPPPFDSFNFGPDLGDLQQNIEENLRILRKTANLPSLPHQVRQVHSNHHYIPSGTGRMHDIEADILINREAGTALAIRTADCLPILLADPKKNIIAAVHAGWRGTAVNVAAHAVKEMVALGAGVESIIASLGPCISSCCFTISKETAEQLAKSCKNASQHIQCSSRTTADIRSLNRSQLLQCGIDSRHIESFDSCTACHPQHYYSYRRDGVNSGRHLGVVALPARP